MADLAKKKPLEDALLFQHHNRLLNVVRQQSLKDLENQGTSSIYLHFCDGLREILDCTLIWAGDIDRDQCHLITIASSPPATPRESSIQHHIARLLIKQFGCSLVGFRSPLYLFLDPETPDLGEGNDHYCLVCPLDYKERQFGFIALHCGQKDKICELNRSFIESVADDIALALYSQETSLRLKQERDFNREIIDSIQALMVTISHCGTILSFNKKAEEITGYKEHETIGKYWVDVLINPYNRRKFQQLFASTLKAAETSINFKAPLISKTGKEHYISWHRSIRRNIETGRVGLVMIGIDETDTLAADQQLNRLTARWEKIFNAIHDPVLVVSNNNLILDANPAACAAARTRREGVVG